MAVQQTLSLTQLSQDRAANTSQVRILWKSTQTAGSYNANLRTAHYWVETGSGEREYTVEYRLNRVSTDTILDTVVTVPHDASGNGSIQVRTWMDTRISAGVVELQEELVLTPIPRASAVSAADGIIGSRTAVVIHAADPACIHTLACRLGTLEFWVGEDGEPGDTPQFLQTRTVNMALPESFYWQLPNSAKGLAQLSCTTYRDGVSMGATDCTFLVSVDKERCAPTVTGQVTDCNETTLALTGDPGVLVRGMSRVRCTAQATPGPGAQITALRVGTTAMTDGVAELTGIQSGVFEFRATDSRDLTGTCLVELPMVPYVHLSANASAVRTDPTSGAARVTVTGNCFTGSFGKERNTLTLQYSVGGEEPISMEPVVEGRSYTASVDLEGLDYTQSHLITVIATDAVTQVRRDLFLQPGIPVFDWGRSDFRFNVPVSAPRLQLPGGDMADYVVERGYDGTWLWQKWASGLAQCCAAAWYHIPTVNTPWGGMYCADTPSPRLEYPIAFWDGPVEAVTVRPSIGPCVPLMVEYNTSSETGSYSFLTNLPVETEQQVVVDYFVTGFWKYPEEESQ